MDNQTIAILVAAGVGAILLGLVLYRILRELSDLRRADPSSGLVVLQSQLDALREQVSHSLEGGRQEMGQRLQDTQRLMGDVQRGLGAVGQQVRTVHQATQDLRSLQDLLRSPNVRGGMGEYLLGELLSQVLPRANFEMQFGFSNRERVDAVLRVGDRLVPVDAKFPLENFRRMRHASEIEDGEAEAEARRRFRTDVRRHIAAIADRYIRPDEGTYDFALMYIPAEGVFQEVIEPDAQGRVDLFEYGISRQVVPVSPQSFYAYLQVIVLGLRGLTVEKRAQDILGQLSAIQKRLGRFNESFVVSARHLGHAQRQLDEAGRRLARLDEAISALADGNTAATESENEQLPDAVGN